MYKLSDKFVFNTLKNIKFGYLEITHFNGEKYFFGNSDESLKVEVKINSEDFTFNLIKNGSSGLAESYMKGEFETNNLSNLIELTAKNVSLIYKFSGILDFPAVNFVKSLFLKNTKKRSKDNISKHYDLGNDFFSLWLDKTLTYSSAIFEEGNNDLEKAQINKYKRLTDIISPKNGSSILEIGCGWGGYAEYAAKNHDIKLDCITISQKQFDYTKRRMHKNSLNEKVNVYLVDYRDVKNKYDGIVSIEMIEAVGKEYLPSYFNTIKNNLVPGGKVGIQAITIDDKYFDRYKKKQDFIQKYIFPGGFLPSKGSLYSYANQYNLDVNSYESFGLHYSETLGLWKDEFFKKWDEISKQGFDLTFKRMWDFYLSYCQAGFRSKNIDLIQLSLQNK